MQTSDFVKYEVIITHTTQIWQLRVRGGESSPFMSHFTFISNQWLRWMSKVRHAFHIQNDINKRKKKKREICFFLAFLLFNIFKNSFEKSNLMVPYAHNINCTFDTCFLLFPSSYQASPQCVNIALNGFVHHYLSMDLGDKLT